MKIDAHQYFWMYQREQFEDKPHGQYDGLKNDHLPHDLLVSLVNEGFEESIAVPNDSSDHETHFLLELADDNDFVRGVVGWIDLDNPHLDQKVDFYQGTRLVAFRDSFAQKKDSYVALQPDVLRGIELIGEHELPLDIQCRADQFPAMIDLVARFPGQMFVFNDMGFLPRSMDELESWKKLVDIISGYSNVVCKINGIFMLKRGIGMEWEQIRECLLYVLKCFGASRMIFGSDWPYSKVAFDYHELILWMGRIFESLNEDEVDHIFGRTAEEVYYFY